MTLPQPQGVHHRSVARPVSNLGNTCYMNAVLQALAHAPELCRAMDCDPHHLKCPVAAENALKRAAATPSGKMSTMMGTSMKESPSSATTSPPDDGTSSAPLSQQQQQNPRTRQSSRRSGSSSGGGFAGGGGSGSNNGGGGRRSPRSGGGGGDNDSAHSSDGGENNGIEFCALCEVENHIRQVHDVSKRDKPVAPTTFVHGFIDHVAPWFQLGVQEDSHEFMRLLIDAMQKSCQRARLQDNPQDVSPRGAEGEDNPTDSSHQGDVEYPFSLFRGTVESNVVCESCKATSSTLDPIEDVGLEVTMPQSTTPSTSRGSATTNSSSRNASPIPATALADVQTAFQRFAQTEDLDMGYKCEQCGKVGRATKQSRLASIPPILTLHLKRFRYGDRSTPSQSSASRRSCRSEVSQLLGSNDFLGKSGSAKIEGHIKFDMIFDLKPYLTDELKAKHNSMFCRLFAVIVHAGKNSHSGHYIAFVRDVSQNEWWKMDDSRVTAVTVAEVMQAEAYMLLYRVVQHPVAVQLEELHKKKVVQELRTVNNIPARTEDATSVVAMNPNPMLASIATESNRNKRTVEQIYDGSGTDEWARKLNFPPHLMGLIQKVTELIADEIQLSDRARKAIADEASLPNAAIGKGPSCKIGEDDVVGGTTKYTRMICELFYKIKNYPNEVGPWLTALLNNPTETRTDVVTTTDHVSTVDTSEKRVALEELDESTGLL